MIGHRKSYWAITECDRYIQCVGYVYASTLKMRGVRHSLHDVNATPMCYKTCFLVGIYPDIRDTTNSTTFLAIFFVKFGKKSKSWPIHACSRKCEIVQCNDSIRNVFLKKGQIR